MAFLVGSLEPLRYGARSDLQLLAFLYLVTRRVLIDLGSSLSLSLDSNGSLREFPDLVLASSLVFSTKLVWGLDGTPRIPQGPDDMVSALPRLNEWLDFSERLQKQFPTSSMPMAAST